MITKTVKYTDYNGTEREETLYFNLNKAEILEIAMKSTKSDVPFDYVVNTADVAKLTMFFKDILLSSYGVKSADGRRFIKNQDLRDEFEQTEAFSALFTELAFSPDKMKEFVETLIPQATIDSIQNKAIGTSPLITPMA